MAQSILSRQLSYEELRSILISAYPNYIITTASNKIVIITEIGKKYYVTLKRKTLIVYPSINPALAFIAGFTIIGTFFLIYSVNRNPIALDIVNLIQKKVEGEYFLDTDESSKEKICPRCKSLNSKLSSTCEWCGSKI